ncbi:MAG: outer membrane beta-barrel protein [Gammaproteobacteria bacterium]|nr:outer membrane beta-barrel protein [Gammaproteobacteria bacterium]
MKLFIKFIFFSMLFISTNSYSTEITPLLGFRAGGEFKDTDTNQKHTVDGSESYGFIVSFPYEYKKHIEIYYSHQSSKLTSVNVNLPSTTGNVNIPLTIDYLHIGGTAPISEYNDLKTFVSGGLGFTYLSPDLSGLQSDLRASFSIGVGLKWPLTENLAIRLETRALATLFNSNSALFCNGGCSLTINGSLFIQAEVFAGLAFKF